MCVVGFGSGLVSTAVLGEPERSYNDAASYLADFFDDSGPPESDAAKNSKRPTGKYQPDD